jgi:tetratricopeptide (TPR) repeat protein
LARHGRVSSQSWWYFLARSFDSTRRYQSPSHLSSFHVRESALEFFRTSRERSADTDSIVRKLYVLIGACQRQLNRPREAQDSYLEGRRLFPDDAELLFRDAGLRLEMGDLEGAVASGRRLLETGSDAPFTSVVDGLRGYRARVLLGRALVRQGRLSEADQEWRAAVRDKPDLAEAWLGLAEVSLGLQRWGEVRECIRQLERWGAAADVARLRLALPHAERLLF